MATRFKKNDCVQVQDGRRLRVGFVQDLIPAGKDKPERYVIRYREGETGRIAATEWTVTDVAKGEIAAFTFKVQDKVMIDVGKKIATPGIIMEQKAMDHESLEPAYAVMFKDENGRTDMAWWPESALSAG